MYEIFRVAKNSVCLNSDPVMHNTEYDPEEYPEKRLSFGSTDSAVTTKHKMYSYNVWHNAFLF